MKELFKPSRLLFYILSGIIFIFLGMAFAAITGAAKGQGLAAGAIVIGYGVIAGFIAFIVSVFVANVLKEQRIVLINKIYLLLLIIITLFLVYRYKTRKADSGESPSPQLPRKVTPAALVLPQIGSSSKFQPPMDLGMAKPDFYESPKLSFCGNPNLNKAVSEHSPFDSLKFRKTEIGLEIS